MSNNPEPAVGQVWIVNGLLRYVSSLENGYGFDLNQYRIDINRASTYLGTLDELRQLPELRAENARLKADLEHEIQLVLEYGNESEWQHAAAAQAEEENAKLRAALRNMTEIADSSLLLSHPLRPQVRAAQQLLTPATP